MIYLSKIIILQLNRDLITRYGGSYFGVDNLLNPGSLDWVLDAIQYPIFNVYNYPTVAHKSAILSWTINAGHVFHDGNKRTSNMAILMFLLLNGYRLNASFEELIYISKKIATCKIINYSFDSFLLWIEERLTLNK